MGTYFDFADVRAGVPVMLYDEFAQKFGLSSDATPFSDIRKNRHQGIHVVDKKQVGRAPLPD